MIKHICSLMALSHLRCFQKTCLLGINRILHEIIIGLVVALKGHPLIDGNASETQVTPVGWKVATPMFETSFHLYPHNYLLGHGSFEPIHLEREQEHIIVDRIGSRSRCCCRCREADILETLLVSRKWVQVWDFGKLLKQVCYLRHKILAAKEQTCN